MLRTFIEAHPEQAEPTHANILAELLADSRDWAAVLALVHTAATVLCLPPPGRPSNRS